jgi:hypothetical protein
MVDEQEELQRIRFEKRRWRNRRYISWIAFACLLMFSFAMITFSPEKIAALSGVYNTFSTSMTAIIAFYFGTCVLEKRDR